MMDGTGDDTDPFTLPLAGVRLGFLQTRHPGGVLKKQRFILSRALLPSSAPGRMGLA